MNHRDRFLCGIGGSERQLGSMQREQFLNKVCEHSYFSRKMLTLWINEPNGWTISGILSQNRFKHPRLKMFRECKACSLINSDPCKCSLNQGIGDKPLTVRLSCTDWVEGGWTLEESVELSKRLKTLNFKVVYYTIKYQPYIEICEINCI